MADTTLNSTALWDADIASVAAIIVDGHGNYLMQLRENKASVTFPGDWGLFGGFVEPNESPHDALLRELNEELMFTTSNLSFFTQVAWDLRSHHMGIRVRHIYLTQVEKHIAAEFVLNEGQAFGWMSAREIKALPNIIPMDQLAITLYTDYVPNGRAARL